MKKHLLLLLLICGGAVKAQKIDSIFVHLYTDSLKKGTYNYINVDGLLSNGMYRPLDSTEIIFEASAGKFFGNSLWIEPTTNIEKITFTVTYRKDKNLFKNFDIYIKKVNNNEQLKTVDEIMNGNTEPKRKRRREK